MNSSDKIRMVSYNCRSFRLNQDVIFELMENVDLGLFQETWLFEGDLELLVSNRPPYQGYGVSSMDRLDFVSSTPGRPFGGVGTIWNKS